MAAIRLPPISSPDSGRSACSVRRGRCATPRPSCRNGRRRAPVLAVAIEGEAQLIFVATPGIFAPRRRLDRAMVTTAWAGAHDADITGVLVDAKRGIDADTHPILSALAGVKPRKALLINK